MITMLMYRAGSFKVYHRHWLAVRRTEEFREVHLVYVSICTYAGN